MTQTTLRVEQLERILPDGGELTISSDSVTVTTNQVYTIDTEGDAASDDLDTISGGSTGQLIIISAEHTDRTVVVKDAEDNILTQDGEDITLDDTDKQVMLLYDGSSWRVISQPPAATGDKTGTIFVQPGKSTLQDRNIGNFTCSDIRTSVDDEVRMNFAIPSTFSSLTSAAALYIADDTGDVEVDMYSHYGAVGEARFTNNETDVNPGSWSVTANLLYSLDISGILTSLAAGDIVGIFLEGSSLAGGEKLYILGILVIFERA